MNTFGLSPIAGTTDSSLAARLASIERMESETDRLANLQKEVMKRLLMLRGTEIGTVRPEWRWGNSDPVLKVTMLYLSKEVEISFEEESIVITDISSDEEQEYRIDRNCYNGRFIFDPERSDYIDGNTPNAILSLLDELEKLTSELFAGEHFVLPVKIHSDDWLISSCGPDIWYDGDDGKSIIIATNTLTGIKWADTAFVPAEALTALKKFIER